MLSVHAQIKYKKSIWGVVKGFIEKNTWAGLDDFYTSLLHSLQSETCIPPAKGKGRRPRRGKHIQTNAICVIAPLSGESIKSITSITSGDENEYLGATIKNINPCFCDNTMYCYCLHNHNQNYHPHPYCHSHCHQHIREICKKGIVSNVCTKFII